MSSLLPSVAFHVLEAVVYTKHDPLVVARSLAHLAAAPKAPSPKEKQMAELNTVMREQVRVMQNEKDKLEREVAESGRQAERSC